MGSVANALWVELNRVTERPVAISTVPRSRAQRAPCGRGRGGGRWVSGALVVAVIALGAWVTRYRATAPPPVTSVIQAVPARQPRPPRRREPPSRRQSSDRRKLSSGRRSPPPRPAHRTDSSDATGRQEHAARDAGGGPGDVPSHTARAGTTGDQDRRHPRRHHRREPLTRDAGDRTGHASCPGDAPASVSEGQDPAAGDRGARRGDVPCPGQACAGERCLPSRAPSGA